MDFWPVKEAEPQLGWSLGTLGTNSEEKSYFSKHFSLKRNNIIHRKRLSSHRKSPRPADGSEAHPGLLPTPCCWPRQPHVPYKVQGW